MNNPLTFNKDGTVEWEHLDGDVYVVTGTLTNGKRFRPIRTKLWAYANGINLYRGSKWLEREGKRYLIQRIWY